MKRHLQISSDIFSDMCSDVVSDKYSDICSVNLHATNSVTSPMSWESWHIHIQYSDSSWHAVPFTHCTLTHCCSCLPQILWLLMVRDLRNYRIHMPLHCKIFWHILHAIQVSTIIFKSLKYIVDCCRDAGSKYGIGFMPIHHFSGNPNVMSTICIYIYMYI